MERYGKYMKLVKTLYYIQKTMFSKIKNIKKYIKYAKIGGAIFVVIFIVMIGMIIFQQFQIQDLKSRVEILGR